MICTIRIPDVLQNRIDKAAGDGKRSEWILEACRMRLDGTVVAQTDRAPAGVSLEEVGGSNPPAVAKPDMQSLEERKSIALAAMAQAEKVFGRVTFAGKKLDDLDGDWDGSMVGTRGVIEIPICSFKWWEDGEQYECLMDKGHKIPKHGQRGMVRRVDE